MDRQRDMVFCHECENEWYRDESGLTCPDCHSDFTEIIEPEHDPRNDLHEDDNPPPHPLQDHNPWAHNDHNDHDPWADADNAPDPDEEDIPQVQWRQNHPGGGISMNFTRTYPSAATQPTDPVMQTFATMMNGFLRGRPLNEQANPETPQDPNVRVLQGGGPNFRYTATTRLFPRDANNPQPQAQAFEDLPNLLNHMFQTPPRGAGPDPAFAPMGPLDFLAGLLNPANMQHGDAVYSQEALDRIVSQLMEQNQSGNAPGPASQEAISTLPQRTITTEDLDENSGKADCSICMDEAPVGEKVTLLPCGHWFHGECIKAWLNEHDTCPHCRQGIMPKDGPEDATRSREPGQAARNDQGWGQGEGTRDNPFTVPESPTTRRRTSNTGSGLFNRMRDAFGGGGGGSGGGSSGAA